MKTNLPATLFSNSDPNVKRAFDSVVKDLKAVYHQTDITIHNVANRIEQGRVNGRSPEQEAASSPMVSIKKKVLAIFNRPVDQKDTSNQPELQASAGSRNSLNVPVANQSSAPIGRDVMDAAAKITKNVSTSNVVAQKRNYNVANSFGAAPTVPSGKDSTDKTTPSVGS